MRLLTFPNEDFWVKISILSKSQNHFWGAKSHISAATRPAGTASSPRTPTSPAQVPLGNPTGELGPPGPGSQSSARLPRAPRAPPAPGGTGRLGARSRHTHAHTRVARPAHARLQAGSRAGTHLHGSWHSPGHVCTPAPGTHTFPHPFPAPKRLLWGPPRIPFLCYSTCRVCAETSSGTARFWGVLPSHRASGLVFSSPGRQCCG